MRTVLIAGAGYVGTALGLELAAHGARVLGLRRDPSGLPAPIIGVSLDLARGDTFDAIPEGIDEVVYAAAPAARDDEAYARTYVEQPARLLAFLERRGDAVRRVVLTTSTGVWGGADGAWIDESTPAEPTHFTGQRMLEGERVVRSGPFPAVAMRLAGIYGQGRTSLVERVRRGEARVPRTPHYANRIHRDDCAGAIRHALSLAEPADVYIGVDLEPADLGDVVRFLARELGAPEPPLEDGEIASRHARGHKRCRPTRLVASGYTHRFPTYREGYRALLAPL